MFWPTNELFICVRSLRILLISFSNLYSLRISRNLPRTMIIIPQLQTSPPGKFLKQFVLGTRWGEISLLPVDTPSQQILWLSTSLSSLREVRWQWSIYSTIISLDVGLKAFFDIHDSPYGNLLHIQVSLYRKEYIRWCQMARWQKGSTISVGTDPYGVFRRFLAETKSG